MNKKRRYTTEEKEQIISEAKEFGNMAAVAKKNNIPVGTIQSWIKPKYKVNKSSSDIGNQVKLLQFKLKDSELENKILKELLKKTYQIWRTE